MSGALFLLFYVAMLFLPGYAVLKLLRLRFDPFNFSLSFSYATFTLLFVISNYFAVSASNFTYLIFSCLAVSMGYIIFVHSTERNHNTYGAKCHLVPVTIIGALSGLYQTMFGSFLEVPADIYTHIERYQYAIATFRNDSLGNPLLWKQLLFQKSGVFYHLLASVAYLTNNSIETLISIVDFTNRTLFLCAIYFFTKTIFKNQEGSTAVSAAAVLFVFLHMGINVFSYVRYYSLAPTMLNMVVYFTTIGVFLKTIRQSFTTQSIGNYFIILLLVLTASAVHVQEAIFIIIIIALISTVVVVSTLNILPYKLDVDTRQSLVVFTLGILGFISVYLYSHYNLARAPNAHWRLWEFGQGIGFIPDITTLNLKLQFPRVMTLWGILVYILFFLNINRYRKNLFILAGMLSPLATILNPFFIDLFLRHYSSTAVWRLCYLIPVHFVASDLFIHYCKSIREHPGLKKAGVALILVAMVGLLLPIENTWRNIHYSRFPTLGQSDKNLSVTYYQDLISELESIGQYHQILTDPMTGYMVSAMTRHYSSRNKFFRDFRFKQFTFPDYSGNPLRKYRNYLLIVNNRIKTESRIGKLSGHWAETQWLETHRYYSPELLAHLSNNPNLFELLWSENDILIYKIL